MVHLSILPAIYSKPLIVYRLVVHLIVYMEFKMVAASFTGLPHGKNSVYPLYSYIKGLVL